LFVVRGGEGPFEVQVTEDYILFACVGILHTKAKVGDRSGAWLVRPKAFLLRGEYFSGL
jgi:hypothetical protein